MKKRFLTVMIVLIIGILCLVVLGFGKNYQEEKPVTLAEFNRIVLNKEKKVLVYFSASWCAVCSKMKPVMEQIEAEYGSKLEVLRIDTERDKEITNEFEIDALPVLMLYRKGNREWILVGFTEKKVLKEKIDAY